MPNPIEEIKQRLDLVDLIQEYVKLTPAGTNLKARCPFHNEKSPSFMVSPEKQIWHCFGCGLGGDLFEFIKKIEGLEFPEALRLLAGRANIKLVYDNPEWHNQKTRLIDLNKVLADYWHNFLMADPAAQFVRDYLKERGINEETIKIYQLGYARDSYDTALRFLQDQKFSLREITQAGIAIFGDRQKYYDRFRNRLMFPIRDAHGSTVGFTGRIMEKNDKVAKYVNTPQTDIYNKSQILYNLDLAKSEIRKKDYAILVEGNMDVIACFQAGTRNVVAVSGTALTEEQIGLLKRFTQNVMIAFDADLAGLAANLRGIDLAWQAGFNVKVVKLAGAKDPDELIKQDPEKWKEALRAASNFMDYIFETTLAGLDLARVDHKKKAAKKLLAFIAKLGDSVEQAHYLRKLSEVLQVPEETLGQAIAQKSQREKPKAKREEKSGEPALSQNRIIGERLLSLLINFPSLMKNVIPRLRVEALDGALAQSLYKQLVIYYNRGDKFDKNGFTESLDQDSRFYFNQLSLTSESDLAETENALEYEIVQLVNRLENEYLKGKMAELERKIKQAEAKKDAALVKELTGEFSGLLQQLQNF